MVNRYCLIGIALSTAGVVATVLLDLASWSKRKTDVPWWRIADGRHLYMPSLYSDEGQRGRRAALMVAIVTFALFFLSTGCWLFVDGGPGR
jgi:hypothetical protein